MKNIILIGALGLGGLIFPLYSHATTEPIKQPLQQYAHGGYHSGHIGYHGVYYICYGRKYFVNEGGGNGWWKYVDCFKSPYSCRSIGKQHFGRYSNKGAQHSAYLRCKRSTPRYVD